MNKEDSIDRIMRGYIPENLEHPIDKYVSLFSEEFREEYLREWNDAMNVLDNLTESTGNDAYWKIANVARNKIVDYRRKSGKLALLEWDESWKDPDIDMVP